MIAQAKIDVHERILSEGLKLYVEVPVVECSACGYEVAPGPRPPRCPRCFGTRTLVHAVHRVPTMRRPTAIAG
jgi:hypothetical protein